jgi:hypothetical protein
MNRVVDYTNQVDSVLPADGRRPERPPIGYRSAGDFVKRRCGVEAAWTARLATHRELVAVRRQHGRRGTGDDDPHVDVEPGANRRRYNSKEAFLGVPVFICHDILRDGSLAEREPRGAGADAVVRVNRALELIMRVRGEAANRDVEVDAELIVVRLAELDLTLCTAAAGRPQNELIVEVRRLRSPGLRREIRGRSRHRPSRRSFGAGCRADNRRDGGKCDEPRTGPSCNRLHETSSG